MVRRIILDGGIGLDEINNDMNHQYSNKQSQDILPSSIGIIIFFIFIFLTFDPESFILFIFITPFIGFWAIIVCYDIGKINHGATWNTMDKLGMTLASIGTLSFLLPFLGILLFELPYGTTVTLLGLGFLLSLIAPVAMIIGEKGVGIKTSTLCVLSVCPPILFVSAFLINKTWVISLMILAILLLSLWSIIIYFIIRQK